MGKTSVKKLNNKAKIVKDSEETEILPYLKANKLACHSFMDTGRRHKNPWSKTRDDLLLTAEAVASVSAFLYLFSKPQFPQCDRRWPDDTCT